MPEGYSLQLPVPGAAARTKCRFCFHDALEIRTYKVGGTLSQGAVTKIHTCTNFACRDLANRSTPIGSVFIGAHEANYDLRQQMEQEQAYKAKVERARAAQAAKDKVVADQREKCRLARHAKPGSHPRPKPYFKVRVAQTKDIYGRAKPEAEYDWFSMSGQYASNEAAWERVKALKSTPGNITVYDVYKVSEKWSEQPDPALAGKRNEVFVEGESYRENSGSTAWLCKHAGGGVAVLVHMSAGGQAIRQVSMDTRAGWVKVG